MTNKWTYGQILPVFSGYIYARTCANKIKPMDPSSSLLFAKPRVHTHIYSTALLYERTYTTYTHIHTRAGTHTHTHTHTCTISYTLPAMSEEAVQLAAAKEAMDSTSRFFYLWWGRMNQWKYNWEIGRLDLDDIGRSSGVVVVIVALCVCVCVCVYVLPLFVCLFFSISDVLFFSFIPYDHPAYFFVSYCIYLFFPLFFSHFKTPFVNILCVCVSVSVSVSVSIALYEISKILDTGMDRETLSICVSLCEAGVNPEALATVVRELKREGAALQQTRAAEAQ